MKSKNASFKSNKYYQKKNLRRYILYIFYIATKKIIIISFLLLISIYYTISKKAKKFSNNITNISALPPSEHYKILLPRYKYHPLKEIKPEERFNLFKLEDSIDYQKMKETGKDKYI